MFVYDHSCDNLLYVDVGGLSLGCPSNGGAAGTYFDASVLSLRVGNDNVTTETDTPLLDFSTSPLWSNVFVENNAKALVPLLWTRVQVVKSYIYISFLHLVVIFSSSANNKNHAASVIFMYFFLL